MYARFGKERLETAPLWGYPKGLNAPTSYFHSAYFVEVELRLALGILGSRSGFSGFFCPGDGGRRVLRLGQERGPLHVLRKLRQDLGRFHLFVGEEPHGALLGDDPHLLGPSLQV